MYDTCHIQQPLLSFAALESLSISSSGSNEYEVHVSPLITPLPTQLSFSHQPQRVMTHLVHKFERRLRTLEELAPHAYSIAMERLWEIHKVHAEMPQHLPNTVLYFAVLLSV